MLRKIPRDYRIVILAVVVLVLVFLIFDLTQSNSVSSTQGPHAASHPSSTTSVPNSLPSKTVPPTTLPPSTTAPPPPPTTTPAAATLLPPGLGVTATTVETYFNSQDVPINWTTGQPTSFATKSLGQTSRSACTIELDGPPSDLREIEVYCSTAGAPLDTSVQAYTFMTNAADTYAGTAAERWVTTVLNQATTVTTGTYPSVKQDRTMTGKHVEVESGGTLTLVGVFITAPGVTTQ